jgi:hypothetical protein
MPHRSSNGDLWFWRGPKALRGAIHLFLSALAVFFFATALRAQSVQHLSTTQPGGMPGLPVMGAIERLTNGVQITWDGPSGYYQVYQKSNNLSAPWAPLGQATNLARSAVITKLYSNAFFTVSGPPPNYAGAKVCNTCHANICRYETNTPHASAFSSANFLAQGGQTNTSCLPCHTVGYGLPTGFNLTNHGGVYSYSTNLSGVQCENCHGPAKNHANAPDNPTMVPRVELAATVCGGCHNASPVAHMGNAPTFEEWSASGHATVVPGALQSMGSSTNNIRSCGVCHSGSARLALIGGKDPAVTLTKDYDVAITCAVCHDPHATNANPVQLRNPLASTNYFVLASSDVATVAAFTNQYYANTNINLCAQCHNSRGEAWMTSTTNYIVTTTNFVFYTNSIVTTNYLTARAPHHSPQYNFLLGSAGELLDGPSTFNPGPHSGLPSSADYSITGTFYLTNQCVACHMQPDGSSSPDHSTLITSDTVCMNCHTIPPAVLEEYYLTPAISNNVTTLITALNRWAANQTNSLLATNGVVAWEYTTPGGLTWQTNSAGNVTSWTLNNPVTFTGPTTAGQALLPEQVKRTRFNLYLVLNDGSFGVHNPPQARNLLSAAQIWMVQLLQ